MATRAAISHEYDSIINMKGIYCQRCGQKRNEMVCPHCGYVQVFIRFDYQSEQFSLFHDKDNKAYLYTIAHTDKGLIDNQRKNKTFRPEDWRPKDREERSFEHEFKRFMEQKEKRLHPGTLHVYRVYFRLHFPPLYMCDVRELRLKHLQLWYNGLPKLSSKYRKNMTDCLRSFFNWLVRWGEITQCPIMPEIESPDSIPRTALEYDTQAEQLNLIPEQHRDFIEFLMETGLRPAEGCALQIGDYHGKLRKILVQRTYSRNVLIETTKGKSKIWRTLSTRANDLILKSIGDCIDAERFVFINTAIGTGYKCEFIRRLWRKYTTVPEDLYSATRHSLGSQLSDAGIPVKTIGEILGQKNLNSTDHYMHPSDRVKKEALDNRGNVIEMKGRKNGTPF